MKAYLLLAACAASMVQPLHAQGREAFGAAQRPGRAQPPRVIVDRLESRIQHDYLYGIISRDDWQRLRADAERLRQVEREYGGDGYSSWEASDIARQLGLLHDSLDEAEDRGRFAATSIVPRDDAALAPAGRMAGAAEGIVSDDRVNGSAGQLLEPGGAYPEELRIGDEAPVNLGLLPEAQRSRYRDGNGVFYRYWWGTVYEIDDRTNRIRAIERATR